MKQIVETKVLGVVTMYKYLIYACVISSTLFASSSIPQPRIDQHNLYHVKVTRVIDGDTLVGDIELPWDVTLRNKHIRAYGYDAWENKRSNRAEPVTDEEIIKGIKATNDLTNLLKNGELYISPSADEIDNFGRPLAYYYVKPNNGNSLIDVSLYMKYRGHIRDVSSGR